MLFTYFQVDPNSTMGHFFFLGINCEAKSLERNYTLTILGQPSPTISVKKAKDIQAGNLSKKKIYNGTCG